MDKEYYFLKDIDCPSSLTKIEKLITEHLRRYSRHVISSTRLDGIIEELNDVQKDIISTNKRLKCVEIRMSFSNLTQVAWLYVGNNCITLTKVDGFDD